MLPKRLKLLLNIYIHFRIWYKIFLQHINYVSKIQCKTVNTQRELFTLSKFIVYYIKVYNEIIVLFVKY